MSAFDPFTKELELREASTRWDTSDVSEARPGDIPVLDLGRYLSTGSPDALAQLAAELRIACEEVGFFSIVGHGISAEFISQMFDQVRQFHDLPLATKNTIRMDRRQWPIGGVGYLPVKNQKLPAREKVNLNEAFLIKTDLRTDLDDNQWPDPLTLPMFRKTVEAYADAMTDLGKRLLPIYATALEMPTEYFDEAFVSPTWRLRMSHYPPVGDAANDGFGINPHVDTTFFTMLAQDRAGLSIFSERRQTWINVPVLENAFVVNTGELLRQWTNDRFISVKHFANNNTDDASRYSIPFFFNANADFVMHTIPSCFDAENPPKYAPVSYASSQAIAQGE